MNPRRVFIIGLATQCALIAMAWKSEDLFNVEPRWGEPLRDTAVGLTAASVLAWMNYLVLTRAPSNAIVDGLRSAYTQVLVPLFGRLNTISIVILGAAAGIGEEWLFRGILQPILGWPVASLIFGLAHVGGLSMLVFGLWASVMGLILGGLAIVTGGLIAPIVAHGVYDMLAFAYIRRDAQNNGNRAP